MPQGARRLGKVATPASAAAGLDTLASASQARALRTDGWLEGEDVRQCSAARPKVDAKAEMEHQTSSEPARLCSKRTSPQRRP